MINPKRNIKFLEDIEIKKIISVIPDNLRGRRDKALFEFLFSTGLRISEALALKRESLLKGNPKQTLELSIIGKGQWQRTVYVSSIAQQAIIRYLASRKDVDERLFPLSVRAVQLMVKDRAKKAEVNKFISPHVIRHSFATHLLRKGASVFYVQQFLGHRSINSTIQYLHATNKELLDLHEKLL